MGELDKPPQAESLHRKTAELLGIEGQDQNHDNGGEHENVDQRGVEANQGPAGYFWHAPILPEGF
jgi:hypothetical protein